MKKILLVCIMLIFILFPLAAQKIKDILYLKNGSMIYGKLVEAAGDQYKIQTSDGSLLIYPVPEVEKFVIGVPVFEGRKKAGAGFSLEAGILAGAQNSSYDAPFSFSFLGNYTVNTKYIFGLGSGVEFLGQPFMPLFLEIKQLLTEKKTTPFIFIRGGKLFHMSGDSENIDATYPQYNVQQSFKGGFSFTLGTGISWAKDEGETYLSFAYRHMHTSYEELNYNKQTNTYRNSYNRLEVKYGFKF
jgi:hypothetical protein